MSLNKLLKHLQGQHPQKSHAGSKSSSVESKSQLSNILKKAGFSAAKRSSAGKTRGSAGYEQGGYEIEITDGPRGKSAFIKSVSSAKSVKGKVPSLDEIQKVLESEGFKVKPINWEGGGLDVR